MKRGVFVVLALRGRASVCFLLIGAMNSQFGKSEIDVWPHRSPSSVDIYISYFEVTNKYLGIVGMI